VHDALYPAVSRTKIHATPPTVPENTDPPRSTPASLTLVERELKQQTIFTALAAAAQGVGRLLKTVEIGLAGRPSPRWPDGVDAAPDSAPRLPQTHPTFSRITDVSSSPGLSGVLAGKTMMASALIRLDIDTLRSVTDGVGTRMGSIAGAARRRAPRAPSRYPGDVLPVRDGRRRRGNVVDGRCVLIDTAPVGTDDDAVPLAGWSMMWCSSCV